MGFRGSFIRERGFKGHPQAPAPAVRRAPHHAVRGPRPQGTPCDLFFTTTSCRSKRGRCANRGVKSRGPRARRLSRSGALQQCIAPTKPGCMSRFVICTVHLLFSGLNNEDGRQSAPLTETLYCTSTHRASSRCAGGAGTGKPHNRE